MVEILEVLTIKHMVQAWITIFSAAAIALIARPDTARKGFICGLISQPAWFYSMYVTRQWGVFLLCIWYTIHYARGLRNHYKRT